MRVCVLRTPIPPCCRTYQVLPIRHRSHPRPAACPAQSHRGLTLRLQPPAVPDPRQLGREPGSQGRWRRGHQGRLRGHRPLRPSAPVVRHPRRRGPMVGRERGERLQRRRPAAEPGHDELLQEAGQGAALQASRSGRVRPVHQSSGAPHRLPPREGVSHRRGQDL